VAAADSDGDGVADPFDNCPALANPEQLDGDSDAVGDACDRSRDGDSVSDDSDNCAGVSNPAQLDTDRDGFGNACDADYSNDLLVGAPDFLALGRAFGATLGNPRYDPDLDANGDGVIGAPEFLLLGSSFGEAPGPRGSPARAACPAPSSAARARGSGLPVRQHPVAP
jgi:hypothetical protein